MSTPIDPETIVAAIVAEANRKADEHGFEGSTKDAYIAGRIEGHLERAIRLNPEHAADLAKDLGLQS